MKELKQLNQSIQPKNNNKKIKILQFGEGNFLRAFVDWIVKKLNEKADYNCGVVVVQPLATGRVAEISKQDGLYTLYLEGIENSNIIKHREIIDVLDDFINPYTEYDKFLSYAVSLDLQTIISNTTESGITLDSTDTDWTVCPKSYPAKLAAFLYERYNKLGKLNAPPLNIIPCELIDDNAKELKNVMVQLCRIKGLSDDFIEWLTLKNHYSSTLVDRIVPGYPKEIIEKLNLENGYTDNSSVKAEIFHLWVLESSSHIANQFPVDKIGLNCIYAQSIKPYKERKVKILNGSHTALVPIAYLAGFDTVKEGVDDAVIGTLLKEMIFEEINKTIDLPKDQMIDFANSVLERYKNPFIRHELMSIALNSTTKFKTRLIPSIRACVEKGIVPKRMIFALSAFIMFHNGKRGEEVIKLNDEAWILTKWNDLWTTHGNDYKVLINSTLKWLSELWEYDLMQFEKQVIKHMENIKNHGVMQAISLI